jgi:hypothetical protein
MRENRTSGSVRGAPGNRSSYRERRNATMSTTVDILTKYIEWLEAAHFLNDDSFIQSTQTICPIINSEFRSLQDPNHKFYKAFRAKIVIGSFYTIEPDFQNQYADLQQRCTNEMPDELGDYIWNNLIDHNAYPEHIDKIAQYRKDLNACLASEFHVLGIPESSYKKSTKTFSINEGQTSYNIDFDFGKRFCLLGIGSSIYKKKDRIAITSSPSSLIGLGLETSLTGAITIHIEPEELAKTILQSLNPIISLFVALRNGA